MRHGRQVGHTLGLRHNFKASAAYTLQQLSDTTFTRAHGLGASVMDYNPPHIPSNRSQQGDVFSAVVGEYDKWAIEYG